ncbi:hypothetical protein [Pelosinus fermentans]|uniref:Uncharacterized protein n=1 Tax=Pelosinus fermentans JBW45 TaxID=1192197 RepID=I8TUN0_9FIRM|nr:hypothetical protein [Pelosinus fermentans]AJQ26924.1 hypothetical protein JBW_01574 [Pelosinus fermentans JBW45]
MATYNGTANSVLELLKGVVAFLTDPANFDAGKAWTLMSPVTLANIDTLQEVILKGAGDGADEIYVGMKLVTTGTQIDIVLNGFAGYDAGLAWREQPGAITQTSLPTIPLVSNTFMTFWLSANSSRFILVIELSTQYESAYLGLMKPIAIENQYPYPLVIGGSAYEGVLWTDTSTNHSSFICPGAGTYTSLAIRRPDGSWRLGKNQTLGDLCVWPTNIAPVRTLTVFDDVLTLENVIMYPLYLYENNPIGMIGQFDGVYWIGNREDLATKDGVIYNGKTYKVFNNIQRRDNDSYFTIEWF